MKYWECPPTVAPAPPPAAELAAVLEEALAGLPADLDPLDLRARLGAALRHRWPTLSASAALLQVKDYLAAR